MSIPSSVKQYLRDLDVLPRKERGQNFLIDTIVLEQIYLFGEVSSDETILEIGPGLGALTSLLSKHPLLTVVEIEQKFCDDLQRRYPQIKVVCADIREVDLSTLGSNLVVYGNLPYSYSTDIIFHLLQYRSSIKRAILLLQREFAERLAASPGGRDFGRLSVAAQLYADVSLGAVVEGSSFHPPAGVESRIVKLTFLPAPRFPVADPVWLEKVVKGAFHQRRKKIHNSLRASGFFASEKIAAALSHAGIDSSRRAETLSLEEFVRLADALRG